MTTKRLITALILALVISALFTYFLSRRVAKAARVNTPQPKYYVAASQPLEAGETLKLDSLQLLNWYGPNPLTEGFSKTADLVGRVVLYPLSKGEFIVDRQLAAAGSGAGLTAKIPTGMRAISVRSDEVVGVAGFLLPGTHVDVLMTYRSGTSPEPRTATVLQDVVVLAAGQQIHPDPAGKPVTVNAVTLLLKPEDTEKMVLAESLGGIYFVLRNGGDREQGAGTTVGLTQLIGTDSSASAPADTANKQHAPASRSQPYEVDTFLGDKRVTQSFK